jgi:DeoR family fructose operon transcriptional repressor
MYSIERKSQIIGLLEQTGKVDVNMLAQRFQTSRETIRRDLGELEKEGILKRTHGGAVFVNTNPSVAREYPVAVRGIQRYHEKNHICSCAASFIHDGDIIFVDNSSTTIYLAKYIPQELSVTIVTNSVKLLIEAANVTNSNHLYICLGGIFKGSNLSLFGTISLKNAGEFYPSKAFLSCAGVSPLNKIADASIHEVDTKRLMIERAQEVFLLADHTKFETAGQIFLADFSSIDNLITDRNTDESTLGFLKSAGVRVVVCG